MKRNVSTEKEAFMMIWSNTSSLSCQEIERKWGMKRRTTMNAIKRKRKRERK